MFQDQVFCFTPKGELIALPRGADAGRFRLCRAHPRSATPASAPRSTAACVPLRTAAAERRPGRDHHLARRRRRRRPGSASSSPARRAAASAASSASAAARAVSGARPRDARRRRSTQEGYEFTEKALDGVLKQVQAGQRRRPDRRGRRGPDRRARSADGGLSRPQAQPARGDGAEVVPIARARARPQARDAAARRRRSPIRGLIPGMAVHFAGCCHPLPGDRIVGIVTTGKGVTIHTIDCETLESFADTPERWIDVGWEAVRRRRRGLYRPPQGHGRQPAGQPRRA